MIENLALPWSDHSKYQLQIPTGGKYRRLNLPKCKFILRSTPTPNPSKTHSCLLYIREKGSRDTKSTGYGSSLVGVPVSLLGSFMTFGEAVLLPRLGFFVFWKAEFIGT